LREIKGGGITPAAVSEIVSGGEICGRRKMALTSGTRLAVRERRGELDWAGSGASWAGWLPGYGPSGCWLLSFILFFSVFFFFCFLFCFWVFEKAILF
jgi:hypothetical protein